MLKKCSHRSSELVFSTLSKASAAKRRSVTLCAVLSLSCADYCVAALAQLIWRVRLSQRERLPEAAFRADRCALVSGAEGRDWAAKLSAIIGAVARDEDRQLSTHSLVAPRAPSANLEFHHKALCPEICCFKSLFFFRQNNLYQFVFFMFSSSWE